jgi:hypothetical protein
MLMVAVAGAAMAATGCNAYPSAPTNPAYDIDVRPIFMAHCVRCHGAGGTLNNPTEPTGPNAPIIPSVSDPTVQNTFAVANLYLDQYYSTATKNGAASLTGLIGGVVVSSAKPPQAMPPAPAPRLNDWEVGTVVNWTKNPICSNSPNPDPAICPKDAGM